MTLIHLFIMIAALASGMASFIFTRQYYGALISIIIGTSIFIFILNIMFRLSCKFLYFLFKAVDKGWVEKPDDTLFERQIAIQRGNQS